MDARRNFAHIGRTLHGDDGQALQQFMSDSPWQAQSVFRQIQADLAATPALTGGTLILDETAEEKAGTHNAGASRQYDGRRGKLDVCRVDTWLGYFHPTANLWTLIDAELFLPEEWFGADFAEKRRKLGIPDERCFQTKPELGWQMIQRARAQGLPFALVAMDALYGNKQRLRADLDAADMAYAAEVSASTLVYRKPPRVGVPASTAGGRPRTKPCVLGGGRPVEVRALARHRNTTWRRVRVRCCERGWLEAEFAVERVWTVDLDGAAGQPVREEWLVIRREADGDCSYTLLNAPAATPAAELIERSCRRYFVERLIEDAKGPLGFDEFCAQKYRAVEHHLALTALALWFVAQTKWDWAQLQQRDPQLAREMELELLPALSTANVRELLQAVLPLPELTVEQAMERVVEHLINRARSTRSRLRKQQAVAPSP
jgi:SRSO17 transposase